MRVPSRHLCNLFVTFPATLREIYHPDEAALAALSEEFGAYKYIDFQEDGGANGKNGATPVSAPAAALTLSITLAALGRALV